MGPDDHVWLMDFGSVRDVIVDHRQSTVVGTYGYMASEQLCGVSSPASDLYGLGATMAAAATGLDAPRLPSQGLDVDLATVIKPAAMRGLLQWMLHADPSSRPASVEEARPAWSTGMRDEPVAPAPTVGAPPTAALAPRDPTTVPARLEASSVRDAARRAPPWPR